MLDVGGWLHIKLYLVSQIPITRISHKMPEIMEPFTRIMWTRRQLLLVWPQDDRFVEANYLFLREPNTSSV